MGFSLHALISAFLLMATLLVQAPFGGALLLPASFGVASLVVPAAVGLRITAQKIRIEASGFLWLREVEADEAGSGDNVALGKVASQSSTYPLSGLSVDAGAAIDGNQGTYSGTLQEANSWWEVDLGQEYFLEEVAVTPFETPYTGTIHLLDANGDETGFFEAISRAESRLSLFAPDFTVPTPTTNGPTGSPTTDGPTGSPTTTGPTGAPTTTGPTAAPTTDGPTVSPTTDGPTQAPMTAGPTGAPTTAPPTSTPWTIDFLEFVTNFGVSSEDELVVKYEIGKNRAYETFLYEADCATDITDITYIPTKARDNLNSTHDLLTLSYSFDKAAIANSTIWDNTTNKIEICHVVNLIVPEEGVSPLMVIVEDVRELTINFDLSFNYSVDNELGEGTIEAAAGSTNVSSYVEACKCKSPDNFTCDPEALVPNTQLHICIKSVSTDVEVKQLKSMVVKQGINVLNVITNALVQISSIAGMTYVKAENGVVVSTFVPTNIFNYTAGASINITGGIDMELVNTSRRLLPDSLDDGAPNADGSGQDFALKVDLQDKAIVLDGGLGEGAWMDSSGTVLSSLSALVGVALAVSGLW